MHPTPNRPQRQQQPAQKQRRQARSERSRRGREDRLVQLRGCTRTRFHQGAILWMRPHGTILSMGGQKARARPQICGQSSTPGWGRHFSNQGPESPWGDHADQQQTPSIGASEQGHHNRRGQQLHTDEHSKTTSGNLTTISNQAFSNEPSPNFPNTDRPGSLRFWLAKKNQPGLSKPMSGGRKGPGDSLVNKRGNGTQQSRMNAFPVNQQSNIQMLGTHPKRTRPRRSRTANSLQSLLPKLANCSFCCCCC